MWIFRVTNSNLNRKSFSQAKQIIKRKKIFHIWLGCWIWRLINQCPINWGPRSRVCSVNQQIVCIYLATNLKLLATLMQLFKNCEATSCVIVRILYPLFMISMSWILDIPSEKKVPPIQIYTVILSLLCRIVLQQSLILNQASR